MIWTNGFYNRLNNAEISVVDKSLEDVKKIKSNLIGKFIKMINVNILFIIILCTVFFCQYKILKKHG